MLPVTTNRRRMLAALQADVNSWPQEVKDAGVKNAAGSAYTPLARNNAVLRTPDDPEATYACMLDQWKQESAGVGSAGWDRIIRQAGRTLLWEWLMVDESRSYAPLFEDAPRERIVSAMDAHPATAVYEQQEKIKERAAQVDVDRVKRIADEMRSGERERLSLPGLRWRSTSTPAPGRHATIR
jgi:hypothetical protein